MLRTNLILILSLAFASALPAFEVIDTVAGTGATENNGDRGAGVDLNVSAPFGVEIAPDGALYITEVGNHRVFRLDLESGQMTTVAGTGQKGFSGDGGPAVDAKLNEPYEVRFDSAGDMFFVEMQNHIVRKVAAKTGLISTIAGTGKLGFSGDGGPAREAQLNRPHSIALDGKGGLYIADIGNHRIRRVDLNLNTIETVAGNGKKELPIHGQSAAGNPVLGPRALFIEEGTLWVALREGHSVWQLSLDKLIWRHVAGTGRKGFTGDGGPAKSGTFDGPKGIAVGPRGNVFIVDTENHAIRHIDMKSGILSTIAGRGPDAKVKAQLDRPHGICVSPAGEVFIGDTLSHRVRRVK